MGRGRQKAKQTRVARDLKYTELGTDFSALEKELAAKQGKSDDQYAEYADKYADDEED
jgi:hypothetical protein